LFIKVDKTYPLLVADIALKNSIFSFNLEIPQYSLVSSKGGDPNSCFLYLRVKG
jgi:hypothetical protein